MGANKCVIVSQAFADWSRWILAVAELCTQYGAVSLTTQWGGAGDLLWQTESSEHRVADLEWCTQEYNIMAELVVE